MARSDVLVSTDWAQSNLDAPNTVFVEVDEEMSLEAFFKSLSLTSAVKQAQISGVTEICPANASFQIKFDPDRISPDDMLAELKNACERILS